MTFPKKSILIDNRTAAHVGSEGRVLALQWYRQGGNITPRVNLSENKDAVKTCQSILFDGKPAMNLASEIAHSRGDADTEGGILNGGLRGQSTAFRTGSSQCLLEGQEALRAFDLAEPNAGNGGLEPLLQMGHPPVILDPISEIALQNRDMEASSAYFIDIFFEGLEEGEIPGILGYYDGKKTGLALIQSHVRIALPEPDPEIFMLYYLEKAHYTAYSASLRKQFPPLQAAFAHYYPVPLQPQAYAISEWKQGITCCYRRVYPVMSEEDQALGCSWRILSAGYLYVFWGENLWREYRITRENKGLPLYHFAEVNLWMEQGEYQREASTQGNLDTLCLPVLAGEGETKYTPCRLFWSKHQWDWEAIEKRGGVLALYKGLCTQNEKNLPEETKPLLSSLPVNQIETEDRVVFSSDTVWAVEVEVLREESKTENHLA